MKNNFLTLSIVYGISLILFLVADLNIFGKSLGFLWLIFIPFMTTAMTLTLDKINDQIDFVKDKNKDISLAIIASGFAIAIAILIK